MRRKFGASGLLALILTLALVAPTIATSPFRFRELVDFCTLSGGDHGFGYLRFKIRVKELGTSGANYFRVRPKAQYRTGPNSSWQEVFDWGWQNSETFPNNSLSYYWEIGRRYDPDGTPGSATAFRMWMRVQIWSLNSGLLAERIMTGEKCVTGLP